MRPPRGTIIQVVLIACCGNAGCRHAPPPNTGQSSFLVVDPPPAPPPKSGHAELVEPTSRAQYREAQAKHPLVMPVYPAKALAARAGAAQVGVRVTVDASGAVKDIRPSMLVISITPPRFADDFREAVEVAVRQWRFSPARAEYIETVTKDGFTYQRIARTEVIEAEFDLSFAFTPSGKVETGK